MSKEKHFFVPVMGVPGGGKNTMIEKLTEDFPHLFTQVLSDKTRDFRSNNGIVEQEGVDYYKQSLESFIGGVSNNEYIEWNDYKDNNGTILGYYGTRKQLLLDTLKGSHVIKELDPNGYKKLIAQNLDFPYFGFYIDATNTILRMRMIARGTKKNNIILSNTLNQRVSLVEQEREIAYSLSQNPSNQFHLIDGNGTIEDTYSKVKTVVGAYIPL